MKELSPCASLDRDRSHMAFPSALGLRCFAALAALTLTWSTPSSAAIDSYWISQLFSNADGSVQYIQLYEREGKNGQDRFAGVTISVSSGDVVRAFVVPGNLPSSRTAARPVLVGTASLADGSSGYGPIAPDFTLPEGFLPINGGTITIAGSDRLDYGPLPTDGATAENRFGMPVGFGPVNFVGQDAIFTRHQAFVYEFYNATLDHYFMTSSPVEAHLLESGVTPGWARTYQDFAAYDSAFSFVPEAVCRFRIPPEQGDSHFFSASPSECAEVQAKFPSFTEETTAAFYAALPDPDSGACSGGLIPLYRVWNQRVDSNHRYVTDRRVRDQMIATRGYIAEGYGPNAVAMCVTPFFDC